MDAQERKKHSAALALEGDGHGHCLIGLANLRVILFTEDLSWFAQGIDIDYLAEGSTEEEAKKNFEEGLCGTLHAYYSKYGTIRGRLRAASRQLVREVAAQENAKGATFGSISIQKLDWVDDPAFVDFPYRDIAYAHLAAAPRDFYALACAQ